MGILAVKVSSSPECRTSSPCGTQKNVKREGSKNTVFQNFHFFKVLEYFLNPYQQVQDEPELAMMASTAQEAATLALIENDSKVWVLA